MSESHCIYQKLTFINNTQVKIIANTKLMFKKSNKKKEESFLTPALKLKLRQYKPSTEADELLKTRILQFKTKCASIQASTLKSNTKSEKCTFHYFEAQRKAQCNETDKWLVGNLVLVLPQLKLVLLIQSPWRQKKKSKPLRTKKGWNNNNTTPPFPNV